MTAASGAGPATCQPVAASEKSSRRRGARGAPAGSPAASSRLRSRTGDLPPMPRVVAGAEPPAVGQPGRWRHLGQDRRRILLAGVVQDPGQELGPFPWRTPAPFLV